jgi:hypothetical protein
MATLRFTVQLKSNDWTTFFISEGVLASFESVERLLTSSPPSNVTIDARTDFSGSATSSDDADHIAEDEDIASF